MKIDLMEVLKNEGEKKTFLISREIEDDIVEFFGEKIKAVQPIKVNGYVINYEGKIHLQMNIKTRIQRICSRCLNPYNEEIDVDANYVFTKDLQNANGDLKTYSGNAIDIKDIVLDEITSQMSMKPLCNENCKGLCSACGNNKNLTDCPCVTEEIDERLEVLRNLLEKE